MNLLKQTPREAEAAALTIGVVMVATVFILEAMSTQAMLVLGAYFIAVGAGMKAYRLVKARKKPTPASDE